MADVITRFKLETSQFDSKLRDTAKALQGIAHQAELGGKDFNNFNQKAIETARALGTVQSGANNTKDKLRDLVGSYNDAAKAYNSLTETAKKGEFGQAMSQSLTQLQQRIRETKEELYGLGDGMKGAGGGSLFSSDKLSGMLQVFGGNVMTKLAGVGVGFASEMKDMVAQGIELAKAGEGVRLAFQRLGRGDILQGLREATHGTVTDLELMKAAVKFNDFKLPLDELGTMLAFAQQKAKDTGQSVDYMVDSIVTGLGRKSLMILDNLGLSASEVKERMAETGDMTKAVGAIIREQMSKAGDYVETAADRATQANVSLQNKMEELGRKFAPVEEASNQLWTSMKIGILDVVGGPLARLLNGLTEAGRLKNMLDDMNGGGNGKETQTEKALRLLRQYSGGGRGIEGKRDLYNRQMASYSRQEEKAWREANRLREELNGLRRQQKENGLAGNLQPLISDTSRRLEAAENRAKAFQIIRANYAKGAEGILNPAPDKPAPVVVTNATGGSNGNTFDASKIVFTGGEGFKVDPNTLKADPNANFLSVWGMMGGDSGLRKMMGIGKQQTDIGRVLKEYVNNNENGEEQEKTSEEQLQGIQTMIGSLQSIVGGINQLGIELPQELTNIFGVLQTITGIVGAIQSMQTVGTFLGIFHNGGLIGRAAGGMMIPGNSMSGDRLRLPVDGGRGMIGVNSGELILNRAQQGVIASQLEGGMGAMQLSAIITGEQLRLVLNNNGRRTGRGEYVTTNFR